MIYTRSFRILWGHWSCSHRVLAENSALIAVQKRLKGGTPNDPVWSEYKFIGHPPNKAKCNKYKSLLDATLIGTKHRKNETKYYKDAGLQPKQKHIRTSRTEGGSVTPPVSLGSLKSIMFYIFEAIGRRRRTLERSIKSNLRLRVSRWCSWCSILEKSQS